MKKHLSFAIAVLLVAMLACESAVDFSQQAGDDDYSKVKIKNLAVNPPAGNGSGSIELAVTYEWDPAFDPATGLGMYSESIECNFVSPNFITKHIGTIPPSTSPENETVTQTAKLSFVIDQPAQPGTYVVGCTPLTGTKQVTTTFVVTEENAPTQPPEAPPQEPPKPPTITLTGGTLTYDEASEQLSPHKDEFGYYPSQHHKWCNPTLSIGTDGTISGTCYSAQDPVGLYGTWSGGATIEGTIYGTAVPGGSFTFHEELIEKYKPGTAFEHTRKVVLEGTGSFISPTQATGTAKLEAECRTVSNNATICGDNNSTSDSFTGTINWEFNGTGVTSEADGVSSLRHQEKGRVVSVYEMAATIPLRGLVSDMLKKYLDLIFKV